MWLNTSHDYQSQETKVFHFILHQLYSIANKEQYMKHSIMIASTKAIVYLFLVNQNFIVRQGWLFVLYLQQKSPSLQFMICTIPAVYNCTIYISCMDSDLNSRGYKIVSYLRQTAENEFILWKIAVLKKSCSGVCTQTIITLLNSNQVVTAILQIISRWLQQGNLIWGCSPSH